MRPGSTQRRAAVASRAVRGVTLLEALIALSILAFGLLGMLRFQSKLVAQGSEAQSRFVAMQLSDELLSQAIVDAGNAACYTLPAKGVCSSDLAASQADGWKKRALRTLPGDVSATSVLDKTQLTVTLNWTGKDTADAPVPLTHTLKAITDVRP